MEIENESTVDMRCNLTLSGKINAMFFFTIKVCNMKDLSTKISYVVELE